MIKRKTTSPKPSLKERFPSWTGLQGKTLWDWISIILIPIALAIYAFIATEQQTAVMQQQKEITDNQLKSDILWQYTSTIQGLILDKGLLQSKSGDNVRTIATTQTALALEQLDGGRKGHLILFIHRSRLIDIDNPIIDLSGVDLSLANLRGVDIRESDYSEANFSGANLSGAYLSGAGLSEANLSRANLSGTELSGAELIESDLSEANLSGADLRFADLHEADFHEADLYGARVTSEQLKQAKSLQGATMPDGSKHP
jgi:uncharacterized protein YjbI with pentapeptide repeats